MIRFAANLDSLFTEWPRLERPARAAAEGFQMVEIWMPDYPIEPDAMARAIADAGVQVLQFNLDVGDYFAGERGLIALPDRQKSFRRGFIQSVRYAELYGVQQFNCLAGNRDPLHTMESQLACLRANLEWAHPMLESHDLNLNIEPMSLDANPSYLFSESAELFAILDRFDLPRIGVQYDLYHAQLTEGNLVQTIQSNRDRIGHIQLADAPGRHQPGTGEINFRFVLEQVEATGYERFTALEYVPLGTTHESLTWLPPKCRVTGTVAELDL